MSHITPEYAALNRRLHDERPDYGTKGSRWSEHVQRIALMMNSTSILDYGCGKGSLAKSMPLPIREYDPAIPGKDGPPEPADLVVCTDVLEHVEPECVDDVLDHLQTLTLRCALLVVHTGPASKNLPDGRNAHVLQRGVQWWTQAINERFVIGQSQLVGPRSVFFLVRSRDEHERILAAEAAGPNP